MKLTKIQVEKICKKLGEPLTSFLFLAKGNHNSNYVVNTPKNKYVLRIENNLQFKNLKKEYDLLNSLKSGIGPHAYLFDNSHKIMRNNYLVEEFIQGKHPTDKANDNFVKAMAVWFKNLHIIKTSKAPACSRKGYYSLSCAVRPYYNNFRKYNHAISENLREEIREVFCKALKFCRTNDKLFSGQKGFSLLHKDPSKDNILMHNNKVRLIDWEFATYGVSEWDLVYFLQSYKFKKHHEKLFLKTYGYPQNRNTRKRLEMISLLNLCGGIGYSVWRLALLEQGKINKGEKKEITARLRQDTRLLKAIIDRLEK